MSFKNSYKSPSQMLLAYQINNSYMIPAPFHNDQENHSIIRRVYDLTLNELRHSTVFETIKGLHLKRVLDVGCNTGQFVKLMSRSSQLQLIVGMDCDDQALLTAASNALPELVQSSIQFDRENDLFVKVYKGDLTKQYEELKNLNFQVITMIEVIQHLPPEIIPKANQTLFGFMRPPYIVITTPNKEFNAHFGSAPDKLRHWDHKFEWNRLQFQQYCSSIAKEYGYSYEIKGIGEHVNDSSLGCCTQMAIFSLLNLQNSKQSEKHQMSKQMQESKLQLKVQHKITCWSTNLNEIVLELFYSCVANSASKTFEELLEYIDVISPLRKSLAKKNIELNTAYLATFIEKFVDQFEWDQSKFWGKKAKSESLKSQQLQYQKQLQDYLANSEYLYFPQQNHQQSFEEPQQHKQK